MPVHLEDRSPQELIDKAIDENRLAHALLVHGQNYEQVEAFAYRLAARLLEIPEDDHLSEQLAKHPDSFNIRPAKKSRIIAVDDMRQLIRSVQHTPQRGFRKVAFVHEVDRMNNSTANAFLKTLEEPPLNTNLLLLTTKPHSLLPTIRSRCQLFRIPSTLGSVQDERALEWVADYTQWLDSLISGGPGGKATVPHFIIGAFALVQRFSGLCQAITKEKWKLQSTNLPEDISDDERIAAESRITISLRQELLADLEHATENFARSKMTQGIETGPKLVHSVKALEEATGLLRLNMKVEAVLEIYLLKALRIWTAKP